MLFILIPSKKENEIKLIKIIDLIGKDINYAENYAKKNMDYTVYGADVDFADDGI